MATEPQIEIGDFITDAGHMIVGPVIGEVLYPLQGGSGVPCWEILNNQGFTTWIFKYDAELVRKADG